MKKMMFLMGMLALGMSSCQQENELIFPEKEPEVVDPNKRKNIELSRAKEQMRDESTDFAFRFFRQVNASEQKAPNWMVSPLSASLALGMMTNGAAENTLKEMKATLGFSAASLDEMNAYYQKLTKALLDLDKTTQLGIANSIWIKDDFEVKDAFLKVNQKMYDAQVERRDFNLASTVDDINHWCNEKTNGCIPQIISEIPKDAQMFLLNALYFKGAWKEKFDEKNTKTEPFTNADGSISNVMMMNQTEGFSYVETEAFSMAQLTYGNEAFCMIVLLPTEGKSLDESLETLNYDNWKESLKTRNGARLEIKLPRFELGYQKDLKPDMKAMGMNDAFIKDKADFSAISTDSLYLEILKQTTYIKVNEEGTEAVAVTGGGFSSSNIPNETILFHVNRPFAYIIQETSTGTILFMGKVTKL